MSVNARRKSQAAGLGALAATLLIAALLDTLPPGARVLAGFLCGGFPVLMLVRGTPDVQRIESAGRVAVYLSSAVSLWLLALLAGVIAYRSGFARVLLGLHMLPATSFVIWTVATTAIAIVIVIAGQAGGIEESAMIRALLPRTTREAWIFAVLCVSAGVCEEFTFRSFLIPALTTKLVSIWPAAIVSAIVFGVLHAYQKFWGALRAGLVGFIVALPFVLTGSVLPSMCAHTAIDLIAGLILRDRFVRPEHAVAQ